MSKMLIIRITCDNGYNVTKVIQNGKIKRVIRINFLVIQTDVHPERGRWLYPGTLSG